MSRACLGVLLPCLLLVACGEPPRPVREFPLTGEVLAIKPDRTEITVKHDDVPGFMPPMTMPFAIKDAALLDGLATGDLIAATLVLTDEESYLTAIRRTGTLPPAERAALSGAPTPVVAPGGLVPDVALTLDDGTLTSIEAQRGHLVLITFIYTRCPLPEFCPRMDRHFGTIRDGVSADRRLAGSVRLLSLSFDPEFDTPARMREHAARVGARPPVWRYATAPGGAIAAFGAQFGLSVVREGADRSDITHNLRTLLVDRDGRLAKTYNGGEWLPSEVVSDLLALAARRN